jgi:hypothetical protein
MDVRPARHYVAPAMELLLILSAMLSAVTGAFTGARAAEPRPFHAAQVQAEAPGAEVAVEAARLPLALPEARPIAALVAPATFDPAAPIPLYADRLIE